MPEMCGCPLNFILQPCWLLQFCGQLLSLQAQHATSQKHVQQKIVTLQGIKHAWQ